MANTSLISYETKVESPFVIIKIGDYTFGHCAKPSNRAALKSFGVTYPNYVNGISIKKINGAVNTYTIKMTYAITEYDDPNMLEQVFSSVSQTRKITLSYGDWSLPQYIYKDEEAILTKISSNVDFNNSKIEYTLSATSVALATSSGSHDFEARTMKPSDRIKELIKDKTLGLDQIFTGMSNLDDAMINKLIVGNDKEVSLKAQKTSVLNYISYLVSCMTSVNDADSDLKKSKYYWATYDDISNEYGGSYFKVVEVVANALYNVSYNCYEVDIGYPSGNLISNFTIDNNESWAILYNYSKSINAPDYVYDIDDDGNISKTYSPMITRSNMYGMTTESSKAWWSEMTQYPISAKMTIRGLLKPALLMSYVKVNTYFYGHKHISSGLYIITKQEDQIDSSGYRTTLSITRVSGDEMHDI